MAEVKLNDPIADALRQKYPSNSKTQPPKQPEREKVQKVTSGKVVVQKEKLSKKIKKALLPKDVKDIRSYAINQVIVPGLKNGILTLVELAFFGEVRRRTTTGYNRPSGTNYNYISSSGQRVSSSAPAPTPRDMATHDFQWVLFETHQDAEKVIASLLEIIDIYGSARVSDYYDAVGIEAPYTSDKWGWKSFQRIEPRRVAEGYVIDMQPPILLD